MVADPSGHTHTRARVKPESKTKSRLSEGEERSSYIQSKTHGE